MITELIILSILLPIVSLLLWLCKKIFKNEDLSDMSQRVKLWWGMVFVLALSVFISPVISIIMLGFLCFFSLKEFYGMSSYHKEDKLLHLFAYFAIPLQFYWIYDGWYGMFIIFIPIYTLLFLPLIRIISGGSTKFLKAVSSTHWGLMLMVFGVSHLAFYTKLSSEWGTKMILFVVLLTQLNDVVQYVVSKTFGKHKVSSTVNPNVTWEGLIFGLIITTACSFYLGNRLIPLEDIHCLFAGLIIAFAGFVGTLNISYLKRDLQSDEETQNPKKKESVLSKIDSLTYTAPLFLHYARYFSDLF